MHSLLVRQLRRFDGAEGHSPERWPEFLAALDEAYEAFDDDRLRVERSMDLMSQELTSRNDELRADIGMRVRVEEALRESELRLRSEIEDRQRVETELRLKQKLEAVGQLAAGIAHEINTPVQYVSDSIHFLREAVRDYRSLLEEHRHVLRRVTRFDEIELAREVLTQSEQTVDLVYLDEHVPPAFERVLEGTGRVASIVRAVKEFAHPQQRDMEPADINAALQSTLVVSRNEYKYVAEIDADFGSLPPVHCHIGDLNQVFLNMIVNAAHAIADAGPGGGDTLGRIGVRTVRDGDDVVVSFSDTGCGIPEENRARIFDPFFTTKEVGRGTGQGLAITRTIIDKHAGSLTFESEVGKGTTFHVRIPIEERVRLKLAA